MKALHLGTSPHYTIRPWLMGVSLTARFLLAGTFLFSGFVKAVDPMGMVYKLAAYLAAWGVEAGADSLLLQVAAVALATLEFMLGIYWLLGVRRRLTLMLTTLFMLVMTALTIYIYVYAPVPDCGCFGDAVVLSNGATLAKNAVLLGACVWLHLLPTRALRFISERNQWITSVFSLLYAVALSLWSLHYLPPIDFTDFKRGADIRAHYGGEVPEGVTPARDLVSMALFDTEGNDVTPDVLDFGGYTFLLVLSDPRTADDGSNDRINDLADYARDHGYRFYCLTCGPADDIEGWTDRSGANYTFLQADQTSLEAMVRSNPGLLLLHDGRLLDKWGNNNLPEWLTAAPLPQYYPEQGRKDKLPAQKKIFSPQKFSLLRPFAKVLAWFVFPLLGIVFLDRLWTGWQWNKRKRLYNSLKQQPL
ncbi:MAG: DoxX family protein [Alloprevotella sp.]